MKNINNSYDLFFKNEGLDFNKTEKIVNESLRKADDGELFLEFRQSENFIFDDKKIKNKGLILKSNIDVDIKNTLLLFKYLKNEM